MDYDFGHWPMLEPALGGGQPVGSGFGHGGQVGFGPWSMFDPDSSACKFQIGAARFMGKHGLLAVFGAAAWGRASCAGPCRGSTCTTAVPKRAYQSASRHVGFAPEVFRQLDRHRFPHNASFDPPPLRSGGLLPRRLAGWSSWASCATDLARDPSSWKPHFTSHALPRSPSYFSRRCLRRLIHRR